MIRIALALGLATLLTAAAARSDDRTKTGDRKAATSLAGEYTIVAGEKNGEKQSEAEVKGSTVVITANKITVVDKEKKETYVATYRLDIAAKPWTISMTSKVAPGSDREVTAQGIVKKDGDRVTLAYALPGGKPPTDFKTGPMQMMFVMQAKEKEKK